MKSRAIRILQWCLKKLAQLTMWRYRPGIVGVTGSVGKTSTKLAIATALGSERTVRVSKGNFNNELGLPLTILGEWGEIKGIFFWPRVLLRGVWNLIYKTHYPEILVLEYGADKPGDLKYLLSIARPNVSVITAIGDIPVHVEAYSGPEEVAREKSRLIEYLPAAGFAVLNGDDETVVDLENRTRAQVVTYGFERDNNVRITHFDFKVEKEEPRGIVFKLEYGGSFVPIRLENVFGKVQAYAAGAACAVGLIFGLNLVKISEALKDYHPPGARLELRPGIKETLILDDCYNASPLSMRAALDTMKHLPAKRRVGVLGDMLELGKYTIEAHEAIGEEAKAVLDVLITVGPRAKFIAETAQKKGLSKKSIFSFDTAEEAREPVQNLLRKGDLVLVKASHGIHLEKVVEAIRMVTPEEIRREQRKKPSSSSLV